MAAKTDESNVRQIFEEHYPDPELRKTVLGIFAEAIQEVNYYGRDQWVIHTEKEFIRLLVGHYIILTAWKEGVWLSLDKQLVEGAEYSPGLAQLAGWGWNADNPSDPGAFPTYKGRTRKIDFAINGYYKIGKDHEEAWRHIRRLFFGFIYKAVYYGQRMDKRSRRGHADGVLKYIRNELGVHVPDPEVDV